VVRTAAEYDARVAAADEPVGDASFAQQAEMSVDLEQ
jgi:hypothetical protein